MVDGEVIEDEAMIENYRKIDESQSIENEGIEKEILSQKDSEKSLVLKKEQSASENENES